MRIINGGARGLCSIGTGGEEKGRERGLAFAMRKCEMRNANCECTSSNYIEYADAMKIAMKSTMIEFHIIFCAGERNSLLIQSNYTGPPHRHGSLPVRPASRSTARFPKLCS